MSTKSHFIYENGVEGFEETSEPQSVFGNFTGFNAYLIIEPSYIKSFKIEGQYLYIEPKDSEILPDKFKIWGDAIICAEYDEDGLLVALKGGHHITKKIISKDFDSLIIQS